MFETIRIEIDARGVATLTLARPEKHNVLNALMIKEITEAAAQLGADEAVRVVVLTGEGRSFCAGGDLSWMKEQLTASAQQRASEARKLAEMLNALNSMPKPLIGRIQGPAYGGGIGMACVCDVAIGVDTSKFALTETKLGLIPATIGPYVLARMGEAMARRVFMSGRIFLADEAVTLGVIAKSVSADDLESEVEAEVSPYLNCAPGAVAAAKALARELGPRIDGQVIDMSIKALVKQWDGDEAPEGISAFFEKRSPGWSVR